MFLRVPSLARALVLTIITLTLSACNISGSGQKGPFVAGSNVTVSQLNNQATVIPSSTQTTHIKGKQGAYSTQERIRWSGWTQVQVSGQFFNEFTNSNSSTSLTLDAITNKDRRFDTANVHLFSHLAAARIRYLVKTKHFNRKKAWQKAQKEMKRLFGLKRVSQNIHRGVEQLSLLKGSGAFRKDNANLLLFTGSFLATGGDASSLQLLADDFADNGKFDGAGDASFHAIAVEAGTTGLLTKLSKNLKKHGARNPPNIGDMKKLPKWVIKEVADVTPPVITITGQNPVTIEVGTPYVDEGATALDETDGVVAANAINNSDVIDTSVPATFTVTYQAVDVAGNIGTATRIVNVVEAADTTPPVLTLLGNNPDTVEVDTSEVPQPYQDPGYTATDDRDEVVNVVVDGLDFIDRSNKDASYTITYTATDSAGNSTIAERIVTVVDTTAPVITLIGDNPHTITVDNGEAPQPYQDPGATVSDNYDNALAYSVDPSVVDTGKTGSYTLVYTAVDSSGNEATAVERVVTVVAAPNQAPVANAGADTTVQVNSPATLTGSGTDTDGTIASYSWSENGTVLASTASFSYTPTTVGDHTLTLTVTDNDGASATDTVVVTATAIPNVAPTANAGADTSVQVNSPVTLTGSGTDTDGTIVSYSWSENGSVLATTASFSYTPSTEGTHTLTLTVTDNDGASATDTVVVTATAIPNVAPTANAGADTSVQVNSPVTLTGSGTDTDGTIASYRWTENGSVLATTASFSYTPSTEGTHTLTLTVTDNDGASATDDVVVTATLPAAYKIVFVSNSTVVPRNLDANLFTQGLLALASVVDGNGNTVTDAVPSFDISGIDLNAPGTYALDFSFTDPFGRLVTNTLSVVVKNFAPLATSDNITVDQDSANNAITLMASDANQGDTLTYTYTQPANGTVSGTAPNVSYTPNTTYTGSDSFTFTVSDGIAESTGTISITVTPTPNAAPTANAGADTSVQVNNDVILIGSGTDTDGTIASYSWTENGTVLASTASFSYTPTTVGDHTLTLTVTDNDGASATDTVIVTATAVPNVAPTANAGADTSVQVNSPVTLTGSGTDTDGTIASYSWSENGTVLATTASFSYTPTTVGDHTLTLTVTDNDGANATDTVIVTATTPPVAGFDCPATVASESNFTDTYIANATADTPWPNTRGSITVQEIEDIFNAARLKDAAAVHGQKLKMPTQAIWDSYSDSEKALYLINSERCARGIRPYEGISPEVVASPAQTYAQYLADNNVFSHTADGRDPWQRLTQDAGVVVGSNADFFSRGENLAFVSGASTVSFPVIHEAVTRSIYGYLYDDKDDTTDSTTGIASYGHRAFVLATGLVENSGADNEEGLIGIGRAEVQEVVNIRGTDFNQTKVYSVMNGFDPNENWDMSNIQTVPLTDPEACLAGFTANQNQAGGFVCVPDIIGGNSAFINTRLVSTSSENLSGVTVTAIQPGGQPLDIGLVTTDRSGTATLDLPPEAELTLVFKATGYANQVIPVKTPVSGTTIDLDVTLIPRGALQTVDNFPHISLTGSDGAKVSLTPNFIDSQGNQVNVSSGVSLTITPVDVSTPVGVAAFPGDFAGIAQGQANPTPIISYGTVEYQFTRNSDGAVLQLANGQTADIQIPIYVTTHQDGTAIAVGDTIPLWSLDEKTGIWMQEGSGTVVASTASPTGLALSATVSHFTWWNCDVSMNSARATVTVNAPEAGTAIIKARTAANIGWRPNSVDTVINVGSSTSPLPIPSNGEVCFWAEITFTSGSAATTPESCITAAPNANVNVNLVIQGGTLSLTATPDTNVSTFINVAPLQIKIQPSTAETDVIYVVDSGTLPAGVNLSSINATTAVISGTPSQAGVFNFVVKGTDLDGNTSTISFSYTVIDAIAPPKLPSFRNFSLAFFPPGINTIDLNTLNNGGPVTHWVLNEEPSLECLSIPNWISLDSNTGILSINMDLINGFTNWCGSVDASNASGTDNMQISLDNYPPAQ